MNIGIAGAGIMGRLLAWQLVQAGHKITLFDKDPIESGDAAAYTAAGMLTPYSELESAETLIYDMGMKALSIWPEIIQSLNSDVDYYDNGSLIVAHRSDQPDLQRFNHQVFSKLNIQTNSSQAKNKISLLGQVELNRLEPELANQFDSATYLPEEAWLCTKCMMRALSDNLLDKRIAWHSSTKVTSVESQKINCEQREYQFDVAIDCRGLGAKEQIPELRGVRGELFLIEAPEVKIKKLVRLMHPRYRLYLVPKKNNLYIIGATQIESDDSGPITVHSSLELLSALYSLHPGFAEARVLESKTNCRPALDDNLPSIETENGLIRVNGLYRHGFLLAPTLAREVIGFIETGHDYQSPFDSVFKQSALLEK